MTLKQSILKLKTIRANLLIASDKVARIGRLDHRARASASAEYRSRVEAVDMAIKALEKAGCENG